MWVINPFSVLKLVLEWWPLKGLSNLTYRSMPKIAWARVTWDTTPLTQDLTSITLWICNAPCAILSRHMKLDGVDPIDNRPSTDKLHHFVQIKKNVTCDTCHGTCDTWHVTCDMWHMTLATWHVTCDKLWGVNILSKFQLPSSYGLWFMISCRLGGKGWRTDRLN